MSTITRAQLVNLALDELNVSSVGQTPATEDYEKVDDAVDGLLSRLAGERVVTISDPDSIPDSISEPLADLLAERCARVFGKPRDPVARLEAEKRIRRIVATPPTYEPVRGVYF